MFIPDPDPSVTFLVSSGATRRLPFLRLEYKKNNKCLYFVNPFRYRVFFLPILEPVEGGEGDLGLLLPVHVNLGSGHYLTECP